MTIRDAKMKHHMHHLYLSHPPILDIPDVTLEYVKPSNNLARVEAIYTIATMEYVENGHRQQALHLLVDIDVVVYFYSCTE